MIAGDLDEEVNPPADQDAMFVVLVSVGVGLLANVLFAIDPVAAEKLYTIPPIVAEVPMQELRLAGILKYTFPVEVELLV